MNKDPIKKELMERCGIETDPVQLKEDSNLPKIEGLRGMGAPSFFHFSLVPKTRILVCHGVIPISLVLPSDQKLGLLRPDDDPRIPHLLRYLKQNKFI